MGFFDRLKKMLGSDEAPEAEKTSAAEKAAAPANKKRKGERPPLAQPAAPSATLDDVFEARDGGDKNHAREILRAIDRGAGLRTVLRAAAAIEANDDEEVNELMPALAKAEAPWRLHLQLAAAMGDASAKAHVDRAHALGAPSWAIAWARTAMGNEAEKREALVDLLFEDAAFARTVAARDLGVEGAKDDSAAIARYASIDAGRAAIRRFGVEPVRALIERLDAKEQR